jgi:AcrR family transcriptional regulator
MNGNQRARIVDSAVLVMADAGLAGVTVRAVSAAAGVGMGTLRHYFPTQRELHAAVVQHTMDATIDDFAIHDTSLDPGERLVRCVLQFLPVDASDGPVLEVWFGLYRHAFEPGGNSMARVFLELTVKRSHERIRAWLEQLADEGAVARDRIDESVLLLGALMSGTCLEIITPGSAMTVDAGRALLSRTSRTLIEEEKT